MREPARVTDSRPVSDVKTMRWPSAYQSSPAMNETPSATIVVAVMVARSIVTRAPPEMQATEVPLGAKRMAWHGTPVRVGGATTDPASAAGAARAIFKGRCSTCHGTTGRGDGIAAAAMRPPPRDYSDPAWQASVSDADLATIIVGGGSAVGRSTMMPANADLAGKPEVVAELVKIIRGFAAK